MKELMNLPLAELERRCRHNGLSLVGGREMMVARLLSLEEAEKQRVYELDDNLKYAQSHSSSGRYSNSRRKMNVEPELVGLSGWNRSAEDDMQSHGEDSVLLAPTLPILQPDLKAFTKKEKNYPVLPASKWAREDDESEMSKRIVVGVWGSSHLLEVRLLVMVLVRLMRWSLQLVQASRPNLTLE